MGLFDDQMHASVFLPAFGGLLEAEWAIFSIAGGRDIYGDTELPKIRFHAFGATLAQYEIVGGCADVITTSLQ